MYGIGCSSLLHLDGNDGTLGTLVSMPRHVSSWQPPELQLLGALCKPNPVTADEAAAWFRQVKDWPYFLELAAHHRIRPLVLKGAGRLALPIPQEVQRALREQSVGNAREAFRYLAELQRLLAMLASAGITATVLKGVPLSYAAYGDVSLREVGDIDLLIDPSHAMAADALLRQSGLVRQEPAALLTPRREAYYTKYFKDFTYDPRDAADGFEGSGFEIDLHWRLVRDAKMAQGLLPRNNSVEHRQSLVIGSLQIEVLTRERSLLYLAVHGATEGWARWKSLADIATLWAQSAEDERRDAWAAAQASECVEFLASALALAEEWMGPLPAFAPTSGASNASHPLADYVVDYAHRRMIKSRGLASPAGETTFAMKRHEARLYPSFASRSALAMRILFRPRVWETVNLPDAFFPLYALLSPVEWLCFRLKRWWANAMRKGRQS